jgi:hypothetical protein
MERLLARLERTLGRYAIPNLIFYMVGGMAVVWVISMIQPVNIERLTLDRDAVRAGQWWRLVTFLFVPIGTGGLFGPLTVPLAMYFTVWVGRGLEQKWGAFRFNAYYFVGGLGTILAALIAGRAPNTWLDSSLLLAFATTFPDESILLFFVLPLRVKWLGIVAAVLIVVACVLGGWIERAAILAALANYFLFFGGHWWQKWRGRNVAVRQKARREDLRSSAPIFGQRVCAVCGAREADGTDIRVCACARCGGQQRALCLEHARNH